MKKFENLSEHFSAVGLSFSAACAATKHRLISLDWTVPVVVIWLSALAGFRALGSPEEARYGSIAMEMARSGDWGTPMLNGLPFLDKPPLYYWLDAAALSAFPHPQWAARAAPLLGAITGAWVFWRWIEHRCGMQLARWTLLVLGTLPLFFGGAQIANMDMLVAGCIAVTVCCAANAMLLVDGQAIDRASPLGAWIAAGLGVLAKGLIGLVLPALILIVWAAATHRTRSLRVLSSAWGLLAFLVLVLPWHVYQQWQYPGFASHFFLHHHADRFIGGGFNNVRDWWFYLVAIPALTLPWSLWLARAAWRRAPDVDDDRQALRTLMWTWLATVTIFFSIPQSKPLGYVTPVAFPVAFLVADTVSRAQRRWLVLTSLVVAAAASLAYVIALFGLSYEHDHRALAATLATLRKQGEPVTFVGDFYYDIPLYARLEQPVRVAGDWSDPRFSQTDDWRRELKEAAAFAPSVAEHVLLSRNDALSVACGTRVWVVAPAGAEREGVDLARGIHIFSSHDAVLWRLTGVCPTPR